VQEIYIHKFEEGDTTLACSVGNELHSVAVSYPTRTASSPTPLQKASKLAIYFKFVWYYIKDGIVAMYVIIDI
jgi:hypothetical protein